MYEKMIQIDPNAPTEEEHQAKGVTKPRYMVKFFDFLVDSLTQLYYYYHKGVARDDIEHRESGIPNWRNQERRSEIERL